MFLIFSSHFDRDKGLDYGRLSLNSESGMVQIWVATTSTQGQQSPENFHRTGGMIPPHYRCGIPCWQVATKPIAMPNVKGVSGNFYKIDPHTVKTDKGGTRGDFGIHLDANVPGSMGCIVMTGDRFNSFEKEMSKLAAKGVNQIPLFVQYS